MMARRTGRELNPLLERRHQRTQRTTPGVTRRHDLKISTAPLIIGYHAVSSSWPSALAVSEAVLAEHLHRLSRRGYVGLTFAAAERRRREGTLPRRTLVVTFDDGYLSTLKARPILERFDFPATVFVVTGFVDSQQPLSWPGVGEPRDSAHAHETRPLSWSQLEELTAAGWEVASHTATHPLLPACAEHVLRSELRDSARAIEGRLGSCTSLAYPYGEADDRVAQAAGDAGFSAACTLTRWHTHDDPLRRPRVGLYERDTGWRLSAKVAPASTAIRRFSQIARPATSRR